MREPVQMPFSKRHHVSTALYKLAVIR
jgi:hypothetical protein